MYTGCSVSASTTGIIYPPVASTLTVIFSDWQNPFIFDTTKYYYFIVQTGAGNGFDSSQYYGTAIATTTDVYCFNCEPPITSMYFVLDSTTNTEQLNTTILKPLDGETTVTTTIDVDIGYINDGGIADQLVYIIYNRYLVLSAVSFAEIPITATNTIYTATTSLDAGIYRIESYLKNSFSGDIYYPLDSVDFTVVESQLPEIIILDPADYETIAGLATTTCTITNISGCFQTALIFTFYPSENSLLRFSDLKTQMENKPPFGYFGVLSSALSALNNTDSAIFVLETEGNIQTNIFDPLKTGMTWLLWFVFGFWLYKRVISIQI